MFKNKFTTKQIVLTGMLAALAGVLMSLEISVPMMPPFYKFDFSDVPAIIALFLMGPAEGALVEIIKLVVKLLLTGTNSMYVGELVNLMAIILFIIPTWIVYKKMGQTRKAAMVALIVSVVIRTGAACFLNACISLPLYAKAMGVSLDDVVKMVGGVNARIQNLQTFIIYATIPFNVVKLAINSFIGYAVYDRLLAAVPSARGLRSDNEQVQEAA
ncbi:MULTISPECIES: ECF transporter S component [unclassified Butyrivibrio]|uniref:ECF transporter S component n=1 Tax=unclassified Butyrivibrio TaxID=2639466 RepID=UPI00088A8031|nr:MULTISPECIES: ECF transporter S component [unclassified Butyrivibrio]SDB24515.1 Riboflavin transporter FmnP [Butyrivibrio sp. INlla16]SEL20171.1 Riboflavin transporter FmnP [Butyrivibrio sp. ob235]